MRKAVTLLVMVLTLSSVSAQISADDYEAFRRHFFPTYFKVLDFQGTINLLQGQPIDSILMKKVMRGTRLSKKHYYCADWNFTATCRFLITPTLEAFVVRFENHLFSEFRESFTLLVFNRQARTFIDARLIHVAYQEEGYHGSYRSWFEDINNDGVMDLITRHHGYNSSVIGHDSIYISSFTGPGIRDTVVPTAMVLQKKSCTLDMEKVDAWQYRFDCFHGILKQPEVVGDWAIVFSTDSSAEGAQHELNRHSAVLYGLAETGKLPYMDYYQPMKTYHRNGRYYSVFEGFGYKNQAALALEDVRAHLVKDAYLISLEEWKR